MSGRIRAALRHPVTLNAFALYAGQVAITVLPLVVLPYLARVLGPSELGVVVFVQYFSFLLGALLEYGFGYSATREVARHRADRAALEETVAGVVGAKVLLTLGCGVVSLILWPLVPVFRDAPELVALGLALTLGQGLFPIWFYGGLEWLRLPTVVEILTRVAAAAGVFALVDGPEDGTLVLVIYAVATMAGTVLLHSLMYRHVRPSRPSLPAARRALRQGSALFVSTASVTLYNTISVFLLGLLLPAAQVAFFSGAEKVVRAAQRILGSTASAVYPRVSFLVRDGRPVRANQLALVALLALTGSATLAALGLVVLAEPIVELLYGPDFDESVGLLRILGATVPLAILTSGLSTLWLLPHGLDRTVTRIVLASGVLDVVLVLVATPVFGVEAAAWALVAVELFTVVGMAYAVRRAGVLALSVNTPTDRLEPL